MSARPRYQTFFSDSARWDAFAFRPGDIVICTPSKCGTTWTQMICALLIFQERKPPRPLAELSPWLDMLTKSRAEVFALLEAQRHRRFIKTHTPLDGLPYHEHVTYICVGREPRDAAISMFNHRANLNAEVFTQAVARVAREEGLEMPPGVPPEKLSTQEQFWQWAYDDAPATDSHFTLRHVLHHNKVALSRRDRPNVVVMHYADLKAGLEAEMRRLAARLQITVPEATWPTLVQAAGFDSMRARAEEVAPNADQGLWKETRGFFHSGTGGHWRAFWDATAQRRYDARVSELAPPNVAAWAHNGSISATSPR